MILLSFIYRSSVYDTHNQGGIFLFFANNFVSSSLKEFRFNLNEKCQINVIQRDLGSKKSKITDS